MDVLCNGLNQPRRDMERHRRHHPSGGSAAAMRAGLEEFLPAPQRINSHRSSLHSSKKAHKRSAAETRAAGSCVHGLRSPWRRSSGSRGAGWTEGPEWAGERAKALVLALRRLGRAPDEGGQPPGWRCHRCRRARALGRVGAGGRGEWSPHQRPCGQPAAQRHQMQQMRGAEGPAPLLAWRRSPPPPPAANAAPPLPHACRGGFSVSSRINEKKRMQEQVSGHRTGLPDRLLRLFAPRAPLPPHKGPPKRPPKLPYTGVAQVGGVWWVCWLACHGAVLIMLRHFAAQLLPPWLRPHGRSPARRPAALEPLCVPCCILFACTRPHCSTWSTLRSRETPSTSRPRPRRGRRSRASLPTRSCPRRRGWTWRPSWKSEGGEAGRGGCLLGGCRRVLRPHGAAPLLPAAAAPAAAAS